jgi:hypothetical protein
MKSHLLLLKLTWVLIHPQIAPKSWRVRMEQELLASYQKVAKQAFTAQLAV